METKILYKEECYEIVGLCMKVHRTLGKGFKEIVYKDALELELQKNHILFEREKKFIIRYDGIALKHSFDADFFVFEKIIVELKASSQIHADAFRQTLNYLKALDIRLALLINFGTDQLMHQRIISGYS